MTATTATTTTTTAAIITTLSDAAGAPLSMLQIRELLPVFDVDADEAEIGRICGWEPQTVVLPNGSAYLR